MNSFETIGDAISKLIAYRMAQPLPDAPAHHLKIGDKIRTAKSGGEFLTVTYVVRNAFTGNRVSWIVAGEGGKHRNLAARRNHRRYKKGASNEAYQSG